MGQHIFKRLKLGVIVMTVFVTSKLGSDDKNQFDRNMTHISTDLLCIGNVNWGCSLV